MEKIEKKHKLYIFNRFYCPIVLILFQLSFPFFFLNETYKEYVPVVIPFVFILVMPAMWMFFNIFIYNFDYGIFGKYKRIVLNGGSPIAISSSIIMTLPVYVALYDSFLRVGIQLMGSVDIPFEQITQVKKSFMKYYLVRHNNPALSPKQFRVSGRFYRKLCSHLELKGFDNLVTNLL